MSVKHLVIGDNSEAWDFPLGHHFTVGVFDEATGDIEDWLNDLGFPVESWSWNEPDEIGEASGHGNSNKGTTSTTLFTAYRISEYDY